MKATRKRIQREDGYMILMVLILSTTLFLLFAATVNYHLITRRHNHLAIDKLELKAEQLHDRIAEDR